MNFKKLVKSTVLSCLFFVASGYFAVTASASPRIYFDPNSKTIQKNGEFEATVVIDVESNTTFGADATITFSSSDLSVKSVANGEFFTDFTSAQGDGRLELRGYMSALFSSKTGSGKLAKIVFVSKKDSGTGSVNFVCTSSGETKIINTDGENILDCGNINQLSLTFTGDSGLPPGYSEPNQCGGTCGSNYNCKAPLFCHNGFCRSTDCRDDVSCECKATPTPAPPKKPTPRPTPKGGEATPEVVPLSQFTPLPLSTPVLSTPEPAEDQGGGVNPRVLGLIIGAIILAIAIILMLISKGKKSNLPPKINPPTGGGTPTTFPPTTFPSPPMTPPSQNPPV